MIQIDPQNEAEALAACEAEPIRTPDRIQPHGCLMVADLSLSRVTHVSQNIDQVTGTTAQEVLGQSLDTILSQDDAHKLRNALSLSTISRQREFLGVFQFVATPVQVAVHVSGAAVVMELLPFSAKSTRNAYGLDRLRWLMSRQVPNASFDKAIAKMTRDLQSIVEYDRVMVYRFRPDGSGEVIAEQCALGMDSFLGLRFPAQDIPQIARAICLEQPIRVIADTQSDDIALLALDENLPALDLTLAELRGTSSVHTTYLGNMGVGASLVLPIIVGNALWGLFSCHSREPRLLSVDESTVFELVGQTLNVSINSILRRDRMQAVAKCTALTQPLTSETSAQPKTLFSKGNWEVVAKQMMGMFNCSGVMIRSGDMVNQFGDCPDATEIGVFESHLRASQIEGILTHDGLLRDGISTGNVAGLMRISLSEDGDAALWLLRKEEADVVKWAGAPDKEIEVGPAGTRLMPRSSFAAYTQDSAGCSKAWEPDEIQLAQALQIALIRTVEQILERSQNEKRLGLIVQELNHRVRNILGIIQSIVNQSKIYNRDVADFANTLADRILALAATHDLLEVAGNDGLDIKKIISLETKPYGDEVTQVSGPSFVLPPAAATLFALVIHEIVTNAVKYGALSTRQGHVAVSWDIKDNELQFRWKETNSTEVTAPKAAGFGMFLIEQGIEHQLGGRSELTWAKTGLEIEFSIPVSAALHVVDDDKAEATMQNAPPPAGLKDEIGDVLVLEDNFLIAAEIRSVLQEFGARDITLVENNAKAVAALEQNRPNCALIDLNLGKEDSLETALYLRKNDIPFLFLTGYSDTYDWVKNFPNSPLVNKPIRPEALKAALKKMAKNVKGV